MKIDIYQIDAFAKRTFEGNPAAVCPLESWLPDELMQAIAAENNLSETAFLVAQGSGFALRWFTPVAEVDLCGHATLAAAFVLFDCLGLEQETIRFSSNSGELAVSRDGDRLVLDFPAQPPYPCAVPAAIGRAFAESPLECLSRDDLMLVFEDEDSVRQAAPDMGALKNLEYRGIIITAASKEYDFVSRFFAPALGVDEDPVTGSAHTMLAPYWAGRLGKPRLLARQVSARGGDLSCEFTGERVLIAGHAVKYLQGVLEVEGWTA
jgi:PhzF family phenazine biosynthesis protein